MARSVGIRHAYFAWPCHKKDCLGSGIGWQHSPSSFMLACWPIMPARYDDRTHPYSSTRTTKIRWISDMCSKWSLKTWPCIKSARCWLLKSSFHNDSVEDAHGMAYGAPACFFRFFLFARHHVSSLFITSKILRCHPLPELELRTVELGMLEDFSALVPRAGFRLSDVAKIQQRYIAANEGSKSDKSGANTGRVR